MDSSIAQDKMIVFGNAAVRRVSKTKQQLISLKQDMQLFSRLYIACQSRDGNLDEFFQHENQACPPSTV